MTWKTTDALVWGLTFAVAALVNSVLAGFAVYLLLRQVYRQARPRALAYLR